jgi:hypothetical protein
MATATFWLEKLALPGEGEGCTPTLFHYIYYVVVYAAADRADTFRLFLLYPYKYSVALSLKETRECARSPLPHTHAMDMCTCVQTSYQFASPFVVLSVTILQQPCNNPTLIKQKIFLICKEIQNGAVAKSYTTNGLLIY